MPTLHAVEQSEKLEGGMICEVPDCGQVALSVLTTACGVHCLCGSCMAQVFGVETQAPDEVGEALREVGHAD